jgi:polyribonucleotide nucleotidyltransferase
LWDTVQNRPAGRDSCFGSTVTTSDSSSYVPQVGERFLGTVVKTTMFGAFVSLPPGGQGLLHITQIRKLYGGRPIKSIDDVIRVGDQIQVEIREIDERGKLSLMPVEVPGG